MLLARSLLRLGCKDRAEVLVLVRVDDRVQAVLLPCEELRAECTHGIDGQEVAAFDKDTLVLGKVTNSFNYQGDFGCLDRLVCEGNDVCTSLGQGFENCRSCRCESALSSRFTYFRVRSRQQNLAHC